MAKADPWAGMTRPLKMGTITAIRVDAGHPHAPRWTKDHGGSRGIQFDFGGRVTFPSILPRLHGISIWSSEDPGQIRLTLQEDNEWELFQALAEDILKGSFEASTGQGAVEAILGRLERWQRMMAKDRRGVLTGQEIRGLFGELAFLHDELIPRFGSGAVRFWNGPEGSPQDFAVGMVLLEIKTRMTSAPARIAISSPEQLWPALPEMYLAVYPLAVSPGPAEGRTLGRLVEMLRERLGTGPDRDMLEDRLEAVGFLALPEYDAEPFMLGSMETFHVRDGFPRILPSSIPDGVDGVKYHLQLDRCRVFAAPIPWDTVGGA